MSTPGDIRAALSAFLDALTPGELRELDEIAGEMIARSGGHPDTPEVLAREACHRYVRRRVAGYEPFSATLARVREMAAGDPAQGRAAVLPVPDTLARATDAGTSLIVKSLAERFESLPGILPGSVRVTLLPPSTPSLPNDCGEERCEICGRETCDFDGGR